MKKCWSIVKHPSKIRNLPPYTDVVSEVDDFTEEVYYQIEPNIGCLLYAVEDGEIPELEKCSSDYRGLVCDINDHGNVSLLFRFKNGNTREIWSMV